jgi:hypothetical protein
MDRIAFFAICFMVFSLGRAQTAHKFSKPLFEPKPGLFDKQPDSLSHFSYTSLQAAVKALPRVQIATVNLPKNYDWSADIDKIQNSKTAALQMRTEDFLGRDLMPDMAELVLQQYMVRNTVLAY